MFVVLKFQMLLKKEWCESPEMHVCSLARVWVGSDIIRERFECHTANLEFIANPLHRSHAAISLINVFL